MHNSATTKYHVPSHVCFTGHKYTIAWDLCTYTGGHVPTGLYIHTYVLCTIFVVNDPNK